MEEVTELQIIELKYLNVQLQLAKIPTKKQQGTSSQNLSSDANHVGFVFE